MNALDEKALRKAWLKRKFGSFEYHEELVRVHEQWRNVLRKALDRAEKDNSPGTPGSGCQTIAEEARHFRATYMPIIEAKPKPGDYKPELWNQYYATGMFRSIPDYGRYLRSEGDMLAWMTDAERTELSKYWGPMARMAQNIQYTVDERWEEDPSDRDWMLDEKYTGPIDWPANWRDDVADFADGTAQRLRCEAGQPCPREGWWFTPAKAGSRRFFAQGDVMPAYSTDYGMTIWQWDEQQGE